MDNVKPAIVVDTVQQGQCLCIALLVMMDKFGYTLKNQEMSTLAEDQLNTELELMGPVERARFGLRISAVLTHLLAAEVIEQGAAEPEPPKPPHPSDFSQLN